MTLASLARSATTAASHALHHRTRPQPKLALDPYAAWMMQYLPSGRAWHR